jgi:Lon protease-like protein
MDEASAAAAAAAAAAADDVVAAAAAEDRDGDDGDSDDNPMRERLGGSENIDCVICSKLLFEPVTTACGHTFCQGCLQRALDFASACPNCRTILHFVTPLPVSTVLRSILETALPAAYAARREEVSAEVASAAESLSSRLPIFPLSAVVFPGQAFAMCIFEPRYRLMLRRIMQGSRRFGLVSVRRTDDGNMDLCEVGCVLQVIDCRTLPDGRSLIKTIGRERFRILDRGELVDGYLVARTEELVDTDGLSGEPSATVEAYARRLLHEVLNRTDGNGDDPIATALQEGSPAPGPDKGPSQLGMWLASRLITNGNERQRLLELRDATERLVEIAAALEQANQLVAPAGSYHGDCCVQ